VNVRREGMGNPEPRKTTIQLACNNRAEQDWQDAQSERPSDTARAHPEPAEGGGLTSRLPGVDTSSAR
jgi:hypothetical protein